MSCYTGFPDRIERTLQLAHPPNRVWAALTTAEGLSSWFGSHASIDLRPGGAGQMTFETGTTVHMRIERIEPPTLFAFTWRLPNLPESDERRTYVEFSLQRLPSGTQLRVVESGFAQLPEALRQPTYDSHAEGWTTELSQLADYLNGSTA